MPRPPRRLEGVHCALTIERPAERVVALTISGTDTGELGDAPFQELEADLLDGDLTLLVDARQVRGVSVDVSDAWAQWLQRHRGRLRQVHMLTASRYVQVTAGFVRRFAELGKLMKLHTDAEAFEAERARALQANKPPQRAAD